jgi:hypothetical protein
MLMNFREMASIAVLTSLLAWGAAGQADPQARGTTRVEPAAETLVIGDATPAGTGFTIRLQEPAAAKAAPLYTAAAPANARIRVYDTRQVLNVWQGEVQSRLDQLFPHGVPAAAKAKIKIKVTVKLSKPPEIGVSIEW